MSDNEEERRVKARLDRPMKNFYKKKLITRRKELPRGDLTIVDAPNPNTSSNSSDEDVEDETYIPSPRAPTHGKEKGLARASGSLAARDEIEEESEGDADNGGDETTHIYEEEIFDVEEIIPQAYVHMGTPSFQQPQNPGWRQKISYKGKREVVREKRKENPILHARETTDYRFHTFF